jgi:hypothetical protein
LDIVEKNRCRTNLMHLLLPKCCKFTRAFFHKKIEKPLEGQNLKGHTETCNPNIKNLIDQISAYNSMNTASKNFRQKLGEI